MPVQKTSVIILVCKDKQHHYEKYLSLFVFDFLPAGRNLQSVSNLAFLFVCVQASVRSDPFLLQSEIFGFPSLPFKP